MKTFFILFISACFFCACNSNKSEPEKQSQIIPDSVYSNSEDLAANAPADKPELIKGEEVKKFEQELMEIITATRKTLPDAKSRFFKGLGDGEAFFLTINLSEGNITERVFVRVTKWKGKKVAGTISNNVVGLSGYKNGQEITFDEDEVIDWTITKPDGSEEGNYIGKYLEKKEN